MPGPADFHPTVADARLAAAGVVDAATALDAAIDVLDAFATAGETPIRGFLRARECPATRLPRGRARRFVRTCGPSGASTSNTCISM
jgi:hypothetical protein